MAAQKNRGYKGRLFVPALFGAANLAGCGGPSDEAPPPAAPQSTPAAPAPLPMAQAAPAPSASAEPAAPPAPALDPPLVLKDVGFMAPESALYDSTNDVYLLSNVNGKPSDVDGNGFISKITPDGKVAELKWIDGSKKATALDAPKGLAIAKGTLYVADITVVRMFDAKTGKSKGKVAAPGSTFLNDVSAAPDNTIFVSDTGIKMGKDAPEPTGTDAIYKIGKKGVAEKLIADKDQLGRPNGVLADDTGVWVVTFGTGELYRVGTDGKKDPGQKLPQGALDGIAKLSDGSLAISSWAASAVYKGTPGGNFDILVKDVKSPADIGYDSKRNVLLVPMMLSDSLELQKLPGAPAAETTPPPEAKAAPAAGAQPATKAALPAPAPTTKAALPTATTPAALPTPTAGGAKPSPGTSTAPAGPTPK